MMTKDEAIKILQGIDRLIGDDFYSDTIDEAIDMAIEALKREDTMLKEIERVILYGERSE